MTCNLCLPISSKPAFVNCCRSISAWFPSAFNVTANSDGSPLVASRKFSCRSKRWDCPGTFGCSTKICGTRINRQTQAIIRNDPVKRASALIFQSGINPSRFSINLKFDNDMIKQRWRGQQITNGVPQKRVDQHWSCLSPEFFKRLTNRNERSLQSPNRRRATTAGDVGI